MIKVAVTDLEYSKAKKIFDNSKEASCLCAPTSEIELADFVKKNDISHVIIGVEKYTGELYKALPKGGVIARFGVGHDGVDKKLATQNGLFCTNTPGVLDDSVAECAIGLMLSCARKFPSCINDNKNGIWNNQVGSELKGKTLAIIGCGAIGKKVAKIASNGFGMRVTGYDVAEIKDDIFDKFYTDFKNAVSKADFISLHIPDIPVTKDFINSERLKTIPDEAILINTARGNIINESALYDALESGKLKAAALDVLKNEPYSPQIPHKDLRNLDNVIMTPHIGSSTTEACNRMAKAALRNIIHSIHGEKNKMIFLN